MTKSRKLSNLGSAKCLAWAMAGAFFVSCNVAGFAQEKQEDPPRPQFTSAFDELVWQIDRAGRAADEQRLEELVRQLDAALVEPKPLAENACWQILKSTVLVELSRYRDARASLGVLAETCPVWEVLNNLAVLEAQEGAFGSAATLLGTAIETAGEDEKKIARQPASAGSAAESTVQSREHAAGAGAGARRRPSGVQPDGQSRLPCSFSQAPTLRRTGSGGVGS